MSKLQLVGEGAGGAPHTHAEADIIDGVLLARLAASEAISGAWDFSGGKLRLTQGLDANKPSAGNSEGDVWWATDTDKLYVWSGAAWSEVSFRPHAASHQAGGSDLIAAARLRTGTDAAKPATGNSEGDVWWATDTDKLYVWDGAAWKAAGGGGLGSVEWENAGFGDPASGTYTDMRLESGYGFLSTPANSEATVTETFRLAFAQTPHIVLGMRQTGNLDALARVAIESESATSFALRLRNDGSTQVGIRAYWLAIGR